MTSQTTTANPEKEYFDALDEAKKRGCSPSQIVLEKRIDAESATVQPDAKEKADVLREKAGQLSAQAEAVDAERRTIAAAWNGAMASWKEAGDRKSVV